MLNTTDFESTLYDDVKTVFNKVIKEYGNDLYTFGIYHMGSWDGIFPLYNTQSYHQKTLSGPDGYDPNEDSTGLSDYPNKRVYETDLKWNPAAYISEERYVEYFKNSENELRKLDNDDMLASSEEIQKDWQQTLDAMIRVLNRLDKEGIFSNNIDRDKLTLVLTTYDEALLEGYKRIKRLNPPSVLNLISEDIEHSIDRHQKWAKEIFDMALKRRGLDPNDASSE